jgi:hypothetical protein
MIDLWRNWISAFDKAVEGDDWDSLRPLLDDEVTYTVSGVPFACHLVGVDTVLAGFKQSIANFDRHFDQRWWFGVGVREFGNAPFGLQNVKTVSRSVRKLLRLRSRLPP